MMRVQVLLALLCLPMIVGCEGCRPRGNQDEQSEEAITEEFSSRPALSFPSNGTPASGVKLGHWITASQDLKSNDSDSRGDLISRATSSSRDSRDGRTITTRGDLPSMRPVVLPRGQMRRFDYRILTPFSNATDRQQCFLESRFASGGRSTYENQFSQPTPVLPAEEFFFVILTERPERFARFQTADWVRPYRGEFEFKDTRGNYRIVIPPTKDVLPLAETMLDWTSTSVLLWDDLTPDALTPQQFTAIADWIRFGGQLIVNGADAGDAISKTSLANLLPLRPAGNIELDSDSVEQLLRSWQVATDRSTDKQIALLRSQSGRIALDGVVAEDALPLTNSGNLVLTRHAGAGRVVQTRFDMTTDWLTNWQSYDSFINGVILARPKRLLTEIKDDEAGGFVRQTYPDLGAGGIDPAVNTRFRIAARDAVLANSASAGETYRGFSSRYDPRTLVDSVAGVSGWNDDSDVIGLSRQILRTESGIEMPSSSLVIRSLGIYLVILIPVNYLVFRLLGRLEYAWLAVPLIAIAGAIWVARAARLDIGFARSQTEIAFLETQPGYSRAHLSRVLAIYNSLSTTYDIQFGTADAAAAPVRDGGSSSEEDGTMFRTSYTEGPTLSGIPVVSNQVRVIHAEQMVDLGGSIDLDGSDRLVNGSSLQLNDAFVIQRDDQGVTEVAIVGTCDRGSTVQLRFLPYGDVIFPSDLPMQVGRVLQGLVSPDSIPRGSIRLVARYDGALEGMTITPDTSQTSAQTVVLTHLRHPDWGQPQVDVNLMGDFRSVLTDQDTGADARTRKSKR